jgi:hypothetical protein
MVDQIQKVVRDYEERLRRLQFVPKFSYGRGMLRQYGGPNRILMFQLRSSLG